MSISAIIFLSVFLIFIEAQYISLQVFVFNCSYVNPLFKKGRNTELLDSDIYEVYPTLSADTLGNELEDQWQTNKKKRKQNSLLWLLIRCFGAKYLLWGLLQLFVRTSLM